MTRQTGFNVTATTTITTTSSGSSSSGSVSGVNAPGPIIRGLNNHSGELAGSSDNSPTAGSGKATRAFGSGQVRSESGAYYGSQGAVNSPPLNMLPAGNICPSGRILKKEKDSTHTSHAKSRMDCGVPSVAFSGLNSRVGDSGRRTASSGIGDSKMCLGGILCLLLCGLNG